MAVTIDEIKTIILNKFGEELEVDPSSINTTMSFHELGVDSISSMFMINELEEKYDITLKATHLWDYPNVEEFSNLVLSLINENK